MIYFFRICLHINYRLDCTYNKYLPLHCNAGINQQYRWVGFTYVLINQNENIEVF